ncbi:MAG: ATP-binding cassette domain-containing protein [Alphaproteobacteria bacterium]
MVPAPGSTPTREHLRALAGAEPYLAVDGLAAGYGRAEIVHGIDLYLGRGQSLCLIGPNGAGKSTVLHALFGFADRFRGRIAIDGRDVGGLAPQRKLKDAGMAYVLQDNSVFPDLTVEENLLMGGYLMASAAEAAAETDRILGRSERLARRRRERAGVLSGGERRILEISRALVMDPTVLLIDEPSIGLEPRSIDLVFEMLDDLKSREGKTIVMVEQNAKKGLAFADIGYVLVAGRLAMADRGMTLLENPEVGRLFLGA